MKRISCILFAMLESAFCWHVAAQTNEFRAVNGKVYDVNNSPEWKTIIVPAESGLLNAGEIHFDGAIKPQVVKFQIPAIYNRAALALRQQVRRDDLQAPAPYTGAEPTIAAIKNFPYTPVFFKQGQVQSYSMFRPGLVTRSNLVLRVLPLSHPRTNYDATGRATITPAQPIFDYGLPVDQNDKNTQGLSAAKVDTTQMSLVAGIYRFEKPNINSTHKMDLRSDGTAQTWFYYGYSGSPMGKQNVNWSAAGGVVTVNNLTFKIEGDDLIDTDGNRWLRVR